MCVTVAFHLLILFQLSWSEPVSFYLYPEDFLYVNAQLDKCAPPPDSEREIPRAYYFDVTLPWLQQLESHPWRTLDPDRAELFIVPFDVDASFRILKCLNKTHLDRLHEVTEFLRQSPYYKRSQGQDHLWIIGSYRLWYDLKSIFPETDYLKNMVVGRYLDLPLGGPLPEYGIEGQRFVWWSHRESWRCTVQVPVLTPKSLWVESTFEQWKKRPILIYYRGKIQDCFGGAQELRDHTLQLSNFVPNSSLHKRSTTRTEYMAEISSSKFCLVMRCDDAQTSRFYDALAAGCIPVVISDGFLLSVAPFSSRINYLSFSLHIPESMWLNDIRLTTAFIYKTEESVLRKMFEELMRTRRNLLWRHPQSQVATQILSETKRKCL